MIKLYRHYQKENEELVGEFETEAIAKAYCQVEHRRSGNENVCMTEFTIVHNKNDD